MIRWMLCLIILILPHHAFAYTDIEPKTTKKGAHYWFMEEPNLPFFVLHMALTDQGAKHDPYDKQGLALLSSLMLGEGTTSYPDEQFQHRLDDHAIDLSFYVDKDALYIQLKALSKHKEIAFSMLHDALYQAAMNDALLTRKKTLITTLQQKEQQTPRQIASKRLYQHLFPHHPYGKSLLGEAKTIAPISLKDVQNYIQKSHQSTRFVSVVGDLDASDLSLLIDRYLPYQKRQASPDTIPHIDVPKTRQTIIERRDLAQDVIHFALPAAPRNHPDFYAFYLANHIFGGGGFTSRLTDEVREKRGLAYSIYTAVEMMDHAGFIFGSAGTAKTEETIQTIASTLTTFINQGVNEQELQDAKAFVINSFPLRLDHNERLASTLTMMQQMQLGTSYLQDRESFMNDVTLEQINRVIRTYFDPNRFLTIIVGNPKDEQPASKGKTL